MRFGLVHRLMTDALAVIGLLALVASGKMSSTVAAVVLVGLAVSLALPDRFKQQSVVRMLGTVLPLLALAVQVARLLSGTDPIPIVVEFAALLQVARLATRRGAAHDHQVVLLSLLHLIAGTVLGGGLTYALALVGFLILTPGALVLSHLRREVEGNYRQGARDRTGMPVDVPRILRSRRVIGRGFLAFTCLLAVPVFLFTAFLFVLFPRVGFTWLTVPAIEPRRMVGFSDQVDLGGVGTIRTDPTLVMRVRPHDLPADPPQRRNLYLRGALFDSYDGRTWARHGGGAEILQQFGELTVLRRHPRRGSDRMLTIELEPIQPAVVFLPGDAVALRVLDGSSLPYLVQSPIRQGTRGGLEYEQTKVTGLKYEVFLPPKGLVVPEGSTEQQLARHLTIPRSLSERARQLALDMTRGQTEPVGIARALERGLREGYRYDLSSPSGAAPDPLDHFLFESKRGHCEFYSTAMAMMLRVRGVPSRNVTGFVGGTYNRFGGFYAVRQGDAHSWVEAYLPDLGWTRFDPTPPSSAAPQAATDGILVVLREMVEAAAQGWQRNVEGFDLQRQIGIARSLRDFFRSDERPGAPDSETQRIDWRRVGLTALALGAVGVLAWRFGRRRAQTKSREARLLSRQRSIDLYLKLEAALRARGVPRPSGTPPRTHAEALEQAGHPVGAEARALTDIYLGVRYGGAELGLDLERSFRARVQALRASDDGQAARARLST